MFKLHYDFTYMLKMEAEIYNNKLYINKIIDSLVFHSSLFNTMTVYQVKVYIFIIFKMEKLRCYLEPLCLNKKSSEIITGYFIPHKHIIWNLTGQFHLLAVPSILNWAAYGF